MAIDNTSHDRLERSVAELDLDALTADRRRSNPIQPYFPSPPAWADQVLYFALVDRFSDGNEHGTTVDSAGEMRPTYLDNDGRPVAGGATPLFRYPADENTADLAAWSAAGRTFCRGTLRALRGKLGYIKRMGVTALWVSPVLKQVAYTFDEGTQQFVAANNYHGYATQNFLDVEPSFGTRQDLRDLVSEAHRIGLLVILDIIINHAGDVFQYCHNPDRYPPADGNGHVAPDGATPAVMDPRWDGEPYAVQGYRDAFGVAVLPFEAINLAAFPGAWPNAAIWPLELQPASTFHRRGRISNYDYFPEAREGDFVSDRDIDHGMQPYDSNQQPLLDAFSPSPALVALVRVYCFWIAFADLDGFRIDTVKHMDPGAVRYFTRAIHEFALALGKASFFLLGEITGDRNFALRTMTTTGLDAALGVQDVDGKMEQLAKGLADPSTGDPGNPGYFDLFRNELEMHQGTHTWLGERIVTQLDDHDKIGSYRRQRRFAWNNVADRGYDLLVPALALNLCTLCIPCIYYGTEQGFNGGGQQGEDTFLRECMFGGPFGSLRSTGRHFFDEEHPVYRALAAIAALRRDHVELRRGRQYPRQISGSGNEGSFTYPHEIAGPLRALVPWSRILSTRELLCAINTDPDEQRTAWVTIDEQFHRAGDRLICIYSTDRAQLGDNVPVEARNGMAVRITAPAAGFVVYR
jgi:glycosidase